MRTPTTTATQRPEPLRARLRKDYGVLSVALLRTTATQQPEPLRARLRKDYGNLTA